MKHCVDFVAPCQTPKKRERVIFKIFLILCLVSIGASRNIIKLSNNDLINVIQYGAVGDGKTDDSKAFMKAWEIVCGSATTSKMYVPKGKTFLIAPVKFQGPCKSSKINVQVLGNIIAPDKSKWSGYGLDNWLVFSHVNGLSINGGGLIDGNGNNWWKSCQTGQECERPTALAFLGCENLHVSGLKHRNSQRNHISISSCNNAYISNLHISAPRDSPNTDGIDISHSTNVFIDNCHIGTGDDCIAINGGSSNINISLVSCGPGHGISVGSLGKDGAKEIVEEIHVKDSNFQGTQNGVRIKTWEGGSGYARKITFKNITFVNSQNPVIIDQTYCPHDPCPKQSSSAVKISDVTYTELYGTSETKEAINLKCDERVGCTQLVFDHVNITSASAGNSDATIASCQNAHGTSSDTSPTLECLLP